MAYKSMGRYSAIGVSNTVSWMDYADGSGGIDDTNEFLDDSSFADGLFVDLETDECDVIATTSRSAKTVTTDGALQPADGHRVAIIPPINHFICIESESLKETTTYDETRCIQTWENEAHDLLTVELGGDLKIFAGEDDYATQYLLTAGFGKNASGTMTPAAVKKWAEAEPYSAQNGPWLTILVSRGAEVANIVYCGIQVNTLTVEQPAGGNCTITASVAAGFGVKEMSGTGKEWGTDFFDPDSADMDTLHRYSFRHFTTTMGGTSKTWGEACRININRNIATDRLGGSPFALFAESISFDVDGTFTQWFEDDTELDRWRGDSTAILSSGTPANLVITWTGTQTTGASMVFTIYDAVWRDSSEPIVEGRIKQTLNFKAKRNTTEDMSAKCVYTQGT